MNDRNMNVKAIVKRLEPFTRYNVFQQIGYGPAFDSPVKLIIPPAAMLQMLSRNSKCHTAASSQA